MSRLRTKDNEMAGRSEREMGTLADRYVFIRECRKGGLLDLPVSVMWYNLSGVIFNRPNILSI